jgi:hypothetical protein
MPTALEEFVELIRMRENVRRSVDTLELCWGCQKICECQKPLGEDDEPHWLCEHCLEKANPA